MSDGAWPRQEVGEARRWPACLVLVVVPVGLVVGLLAWLFAGDVFGAGDPFGDARACAGSDTALAPALEQEQIGLPSATAGLRYSTHLLPGGPSAGYSFVAVFHTSRQALVDYLAAQGLADPDRSAHPDDANDGSVMGDPVGEDAGCGMGGITASFVSIPKDLDVDRRFTVAVELGEDLKIPSAPEVIITVT